MNATATAGKWIENYEENISILFDTTLNPERITIQKRGEKPIHIHLPDGITIDDAVQARDMTKVAFNLKTLKQL